ncbi:hypothetical protein M011DRAFT_468189 [Sporormia fimetaria CBS 119925]|uniref:Uncharacterized protein n=1 Tax=Sporormia fimetaria CBS 119925 TaxID=1340428 RepID=A0A6A6V8Q5_9PLEO|nr:hypothetical protein M011DRAFT_468189 [Sporormia fimetaria CBS 119925]
MLNYARQTLKRVPSFQELLQGKMGSAVEEINVDVLVIGAGPTGLGAAKRLHQIVRAASPAACDRPSNRPRMAPHG